MAQLERQGVPIVLSAPSGAGKTTLCQHLVRQSEDVQISISCTTRDPRGDERDGVDYFFLTEDQFASKVAHNQLLEWATVHGHRYGTPADPVRQALADGCDVLLPIDVQGGLQIARQLSDTVLIFVLPPSMRELARRLRLRGTDTEAQIQKRLRAAQEETAAAHRYSHWLINDDLDSTVEELKIILTAERIRHRIKASMDSLLSDI